MHVLNVLNKSIKVTYSYFDITNSMKGNNAQAQLVIIFIQT